MKTKKTFKKISIPIDIYDNGIHIIIGNDFEKIDKWLTGHFREDISCSGGINGVDAETFFYNGYWPAIHLTKYSEELLVHELFHAVYEIMNGVGMTLSNDSQESYAYLLGYLFKEIRKKIKKEK